MDIPLCPYLKPRITFTLTPHEIPPFLTPQNKPQTPPVLTL